VNNDLCEQCGGASMGQTLGGFPMCDNCGWIDESRVPEDIDSEEEHERRAAAYSAPQRGVSARIMADRTLTTEQLVDKERLLMQHGTRQARNITAADRATEAQFDCAGVDFDKVPDRSLTMPTFFDAFQLVLVWHVRALARVLHVDAQVLADVVGAMWIEYVQTRETFITYRPPARVFVPRKVMIRARQLRRDMLRAIGQEPETFEEETAAVMAELGMSGPLPYTDDDKPRKRTFVAKRLEIRNRPRLLVVLSLLWLATLDLKLGVLPSDIVRWCIEGQLPYFAAALKFTQEQEDLPQLDGSTARPNARSLTFVTKGLMKQLKLPAEYWLNMPLAVARTAKQLELPRGVQDAYAFLCVNEAVPQVRFRNVQTQHSGLIVELNVVAHLVVAIKARYGLGFDDSTAEHRAADFDDIRRWLTTPPRGARMPPDFRMLSLLDSQRLVNLCLLAQSCEQRLRTVGSRARDALLIEQLCGFSPLAGRPREESARNNDDDDDDDDDDGVETRRQPPVVPLYRRWRLNNSRQAHEPLLDLLHAMMVWHFQLDKRLFLIAINRLELGLFGHKGGTR
jgi:hypothetical protein